MGRFEWTHSPNRERIFVDGGLRLQWLEVGGRVKGTFKKAHVSLLAQGPNREWRLFDIDDIEWDWEYDGWMFNWEDGTPAALVSVLVSCLSVYQAEVSQHTSRGGSLSHSKPPLGCI